MKAMIFAAGLGTRLKPWTLHHPKALVPVGGVPMLERVIVKLKSQGFDDFVINVHHFADQIIDFVNAADFGVTIRFSDERERLLDTGGGLLKAAPLLFADNEPVLIHNADILSDANLQQLMSAHKGDATLLVSDRNSSRKLVVNGNSRLCGWHNEKSDEYRPAGFVPAAGMSEVAFSGIHVVSPSVIAMMRNDGYPEAFPIMDFYLARCGDADFNVHKSDNLQLIDIGKPETLAIANRLV